MTILIVEDEDALASGLKFNFELEGYRVRMTSDGPAALEAFQVSDPPVRVVVLDLMLPGMSGYEICRRIREMDPQVPILVLSARSLSEDRTLAFDAGADQYMTKPFELRELLSRIKNLLNPRKSGRGGRPPEWYRFGNVEVDVRRFEVRIQGATHVLTSREMQLLRYFIEHEGDVLSRQAILEDVWGERSDQATRSIDNFVLRLRKLIEANPAEPQHILSVRGTGYRFVSRPVRDTGKSRFLTTESRSHGEQAEE